MLSPSNIENAVVAFACLVRAIVDGDKAWQLQQLTTLKQYGFTITHKEGSIDHTHPNEVIHGQ